MANFNNFDLNILQELMAILKEDYASEITPEELTEEYNNFSEIYNTFFGMSEESRKYGIDIYKIWREYKGSKEAIEVLKATIEYEKSLQLYEETKKI